MFFSTRCPACRTLFKVNEAQLKVSACWVRCGECRHVYDSGPGLQPVGMPELPLLTERIDASQWQALAPQAAPPGGAAAAAPADAPIEQARWAPQSPSVVPASVLVPEVELVQVPKTLPLASPASDGGSTANGLQDDAPVPQALAAPVLLPPVPRVGGLSVSLKPTAAAPAAAAVSAGVQAPGPKLSNIRVSARPDVRHFVLTPTQLVGPMPLNPAQPTNVPAPSNSVEGNAVDLATGLAANANPASKAPAAVTPSGAALPAFDPAAMRPLVRVPVVNAPPAATPPVVTPGMLEGRVPVPLRADSDLRIAVYLEADQAAEDLPAALAEQSVTLANPVAASALPVTQSAVLAPGPTAATEPAALGALVVADADLVPDSVAPNSLTASPSTPASEPAASPVGLAQAPAEPPVLVHLGPSALDRLAERREPVMTAFDSGVLASDAGPLAPVSALPSVDPGGSGEPSAWRFSRLLAWALLPLLLLALMGQWLWHDRERAVQRLPGLLPVADAMCRWLPCPSPASALAGLRIDSTELVRVQGRVHQLQLVLHNSSGRALPLPSVELSLTDAQSQARVRRVLTVASAQADVPLASELAPEQRVVLHWRFELDASTQAQTAHFQTRLLYP